MGSLPSTVVAFQNRRHKTWVAVRPWLFVLGLGIIGEAVSWYIERDHIQTRHLGSFILSNDKYSLPLQDMTVWSFTLSLVSFILIGAAIIAASIYINRYFRCPRCETVPMFPLAVLGLGSGSLSWQSRLDPNPVVCQKCGARLR
jgi:hypothetical protein